MGNCICPPTEGDKQNNMVDKQIDRDRKRLTKVKKILFLGSGGSGKSTIFKQLRGIYGTGFNHSERKQFVGHIHEQVITQMKLALEVLEEYRSGDFDGLLRQNERAYIDEKQSEDDDTDSDDDYDDDDDEDIPELSDGAHEAAEYINNVHFTSYKLTDDTVAYLKCLWAEPAIQKMYEMRNITKIEDSSAYFWNKLESLNNISYVPDEADILLVRNRTTGAKEEKYDMPDGKGSFAIVDVGGQKSERKKWIKCFDSVTAVIFVASLSCYDEVLFEDYAINSMTDQLDLFDDVCNNLALRETSMILFLNKKDLFIEKIKSVAITKCLSFSDYSGEPTGFDATTQYIRKAFTSLNNMPNRKNIFTHITCATDQDNIQKVFADVQHIVIEASLIQAGLMDWDDNQRFQSVDMHSPEAASSPMGDPQTAALIRESIMTNKKKSVTAGLYTNIAAMNGGFRGIIKSRSIPAVNSIQYSTILQQYKYADIGENSNDFNDEYGILRCRYCWGYNQEETFVVVDMEPDIEIQSNKERKKLNLCIVLDLSDLMAGSFTDGQHKMESVKQCVIDIIRALEEEDRLSLITFSKKVQVIQDIDNISRMDIDLLCEIIANDVECASAASNAKQNNERTRVDFTGFECALSQFKKLRTQKKVSQDFDNRIMMISGARLSEKILNDARDAANNAESMKRIYSTFIGICTRFNLQRSDLNEISGCNHYCIYSSEQLREKLVMRFDEMMTPLMFNLNVRLQNVDIDHDDDDRDCVHSVHRLNGLDSDQHEMQQNGSILNRATVFLTRRKSENNIYDEEYDEDRYLLLCKLVARNRENLNLILSFEDRSAQTKTNVISIALQKNDSFECNEEESNLYEEEHKHAALLNGKYDENTQTNDYYDNNSIRKAILLSRYVAILREWIQEINEAKNGSASHATQKKIQQFIKYFQTEARAINDRLLSQEISVLQAMLR